MKKNLYYEYRSWVIFWGIFLDGQEAVQKVLDDHNKKGWTVVQFEWGSTRKFTLFKLIFIFLVTVITLGILSYWTGFAIIFEKEDSSIKNEKANHGSVNSERIEGVDNLQLKEKIIDTEKINDLNALIKKQKGSVFSMTNHKENIIELTNELCSSKDQAEKVLEHYMKLYNKDLIEELKGITSSYDGIKSYVYNFIQLGLIDENYPHNRIK